MKNKLNLMARAPENPFFSPCLALGSLYLEDDFAVGAEHEQRMYSRSKSVPRADQETTPVSAFRRAM